MDKSTYTPPELAREYGVSTDKIGYWIATGQLAAMNMATRADGRPRYKITSEAKAAFEARRAVVPAPKPVRRKRQALPAGFVRHFR